MYNCLFLVVLEISFCVQSGFKFLLLCCLTFSISKDFQCNTPYISKSFKTVKTVFLYNL